MAAPLCAQQVQPGPVARPDPIEAPIETPVETPIGTEASTLELNPSLPPRNVTLPATVDIRIATWNFAAKPVTDASKPEGGDARIAPPPTTVTPPPKVWRHTFGSERTTPEWRRRGKAPASVGDIVAVQGIRSLAEVRRMLNARRYYVVASRQLVTIRNPASPGLPVLRHDPPATTAIAMRRTRGIRPAGFRHFLPPRPSADQQSGTQLATPEPPAITALRLRIYGKMLWVASIDAPAGCMSLPVTDACRPYAALLEQFIDWAREVGQQTPMVLLGQWPPGLMTKLSDAGINIEINNKMAKSIECSPAPSDILVAAPKAQQPITLAQTQIAASRHCIAAKNVVLKLR